MFECVTGAKFTSDQINEFLAWKERKQHAGKEAKEHIAVKKFHSKWEGKARENAAVMKILESVILLYEEEKRIFWGKVEDCGLTPE